MTGYVGGDVVVQFGLEAAPPTFRTLAKGLIEEYLGTPGHPVPFGGRDAELGALDEWLAADAPPNALVFAPAGRGKTALLVRWVAHLDADWPVAFVPISIRADTNRPEVFYQVLATRLAHVLGRPLTSMPVGDPVLFYRDKVVELYEELSRDGKRCVVVVDGLDEAVGWLVHPSVLPARPPRGIKVVVSARLLAGDVDDTRWQSRLGWLEHAESVTSVPVQPLDREGVADVLTKMAFPLDKLGANVDVVAQLHRLTEGGDPLLLRFYVQDLLEKGEEAASLTPEDLLHLKPGYKEYFERWFDQLETSWKGIAVDRELIDAVMAILACALGPLPFPVLEGMLGRIKHGAKVVSVKALRPIERFVIGEPVKTGYVLSHPKLGDFLREEHFAGGAIIATVRREFAAWGQEVVLGLNAGRIKPESAPRYALLHHARHLAQLEPHEALACYPALLEEGWLRAWRAGGGGSDGYTRDVTLARQAMRAAAEADPRVLRAPHVGAAGQARCALILSSIRSAGAQTPAELLGEFLRDGLISPREALYLVRLKPDKERGDAVATIADAVPEDMLAEAQAIAYEIADPVQRVKALLATGRRASATERAAVERTIRRLGRAADAVVQVQILTAFAAAEASEALFSEALTAAERLPMGGAGDVAFQALQIALRVYFDYRLPPPWQERIASVEERRTASSSEGAATPAGTTGAAASETAWTTAAERPRRWATSALARDASREARATALIADIDATGLEDHSIRQLASTFVAQCAAEAVAIPDETAEACVVRVVDAVLRGGPWVWRLLLLRDVIPHLSAPVRERVLRSVFMIEGFSTYERGEILEALAPGLSRELLDEAFESIAKIPDRFDRTDSFASLLRGLPDDEIARRADVVLRNSDDYLVGHFITELDERLSDDIRRRTLAWATSQPDEWRHQSALRALVPRLPDELLPDAVEAARIVQDERYRGEILLALVRRMRSSKQPGGLRGLQETAFLIGDASVSTLALATLHHRLPTEDQAWVSASVLQQATQAGPGSDREGEFLPAAAALALLAGGLPASDASSHLLSMLGRLQSRDMDEPRWLAQAVLASRLPGQDAAAVLASLLERAAEFENEASRLLPLLGAVLSPSPEFAARALERVSRHTGERGGITPGLVLLATALAPFSSPELSTERLGAAMEYLREPGDLDERDRNMLGVLLAASMPLFASVIPEVTLRQWFAEAAAAVKPEPGAPSPVQFLQVFVPWATDAELADSFLTIMGESEPVSQVRAGLLFWLSACGGLLGQLLRSNPRFARVADGASPLDRLGGSTASVEVAHAIRDVTRWWA